MKITLPPKGEILLKRYKEFSGEPSATLLIRCLEEAMKRDKDYQGWLKAKPETKAPNQPKPEKNHPQAASVKAQSAPVKAQPVPTASPADYNEDELR